MNVMTSLMVFGEGPKDGNDDEDANGRAKSEASKDAGKERIVSKNGCRRGWDGGRKEGQESPGSAKGPIEANVLLASLGQLRVKPFYYPYHSIT